MKIGVVGYGSIGRRHADSIRLLKHHAVIYDPLGPRDVKFERNIYEQCDAVVIATPSFHHESGLRACIERGRHVLVEKPICTETGHLPQLLEIAAAKNLVVMMGNNLRFHPCVPEARRWLSCEMIGKPLWAQFTCATLSAKAPYLSDGVILNTGAHEVDLAMHLLGPAAVLSATAHRGPYGDDIADFVLQHEDGCRSSFHLDFVTRPEIRDFRIAGEDGDLFCHLPNRYMSRRQADDKLPVFYDDHFHAGSSYDDDYIAEMRAFIGAIEGEPFQGATGASGLATLQVLLDVRKKAGL